MFKKGDSLIAIDDCPINHLTKGKVYISQSDEVHSATNLSPFIQIINDNGRKAAIYSYKFISSIQTNPSPNISPAVKFKKGDIVRCKTSHFNQFTAGNYYTVREDFLSSNLTLKLVSDDLGQPNGWDVSKFEYVNIILQNSTASIQPINIDITMNTIFDSKPKAISNECKPCTCESLVLFRKGCQCGAIVKKNWGQFA